MKDICNKVILEHPAIKRVSGVITFVSQGSVSAAVAITGSTAIVTLLNKTCQILEVGDYVWIHYWKSINDGYIAIRNGDGEYRIGAGDSTNNSAISIDNAFLLREGSYEYVTTHSYNPNHSYDTLHNFIKPDSGAVGAITATDYFPDVCTYLDNRFPNESHSLHVQQSYLYEETLDTSGGAYTINYWQQLSTPSYTAGNNYNMYRSLTIPNYVFSGGNVYLDTKSIYFENEEPVAGSYLPVVVVAASAHEAEKRYPIYATAGTMIDLSDFRLVLTPIFINYEGLYDVNSLTLNLTMHVFQYDHTYDYWYDRNLVNITEYTISVPLNSIKVDTNTHVGNMVDTKERSVVV